MNVYFDIETAPLPREEALLVAPAFEADGRLTDPKKILADVEKKETNWLDRAALDALTGMVALFGWANDEGKPKTMDITNHAEKEIVTFAVDGLNKALMAGSKVVGFNIRSFDIPFLLRRAIIHNLTIPQALKTQAVYRYSESIVDLLDIWLFGDRDYKGQSLKNICIRCGFGNKTDDAKHFADLMQLDYKAALEYAINDVEITRTLAKRMGY